MTRAAHLIRPPTQQPRRRVREQASTEYAPGHFLAPEKPGVPPSERLCVNEGDAMTLKPRDLERERLAGWVAGQPETMA